MALANVSKMQARATLSKIFLKKIRIFEVHQFSKVEDVSDETPEIEKVSVKSEDMDVCSGGYGGTELCERSLEKDSEKD